MWVYNVELYYYMGVLGCIKYAPEILVSRVKSQLIYFVAGNMTFIISLGNVSRFYYHCLIRPLQCRFNLHEIPPSPNLITIAGARNIIPATLFFMVGGE